MNLVKDNLVPDVYTSYFAALNKLPDHVAPIAICLRTPRFMKAGTPRYQQLAPTAFILALEEAQYTPRFKAEILGRLNPKQVVLELERLAGGRIPCLICYEANGKFCHRHLVADWLNEHGIVTREFIFERKSRTQADLYLPAPAKMF